ncbi:MAG: pentapeptide repeat-containing protein [Methanothrix sp.]|nr:pentapeptide repeat-containing protein [Methanothrix sp.]
MAWRSIALIAVLAMVAVSTSCAQQVVPAEEILAKIASDEPVYYDSIRVLGDLDLKSLPEAQVSASFAITNSTIINASFTGITFAKDAVFWGTTFGNASFEKAAFQGQADFANTTFCNASFTAASFAQPAFFDGVLFRDNVSFADTKFSKDAFFNEARFLATADFNYSDFASYSYFAAAHFLGDALFSDVDFSGALDISAASFAGRANFFQSRFSSAGFSDAVFSGPVQFGLADFSGLSSFGGALFAKEANFNLARFSQAAYFSGAEFRGLALFGLTKFQDIASLQSAKFEGDLNFKGASISTMLLDKAKFGKDSRIILNDTDFSRFKAHWNEIEEHVVWDPGAYLALVNNYHGLGWSADEDDCYYQYRSLNQGKKQWGWSKAIDLLAWLSCGYGVRPGYAVAWSLLTILAFALLFWRGDGIRRSARPLNEPAEVDSVPERVTLRNALFFSTMVFLSQGPIDFLPVGRHRYYVILEGILGWLLLALFLVTLGRVMIR